MIKKREVTQERVEFFNRFQAQALPAVGSGQGRRPENMTRTRIYSETFLKRILEGTENVKAHGLERCVCINADGEAIFYNVGNEHSVSIPNRKNALKDGIITHTHPSATPPSPADLRFFFSEEIREFSTITRYGTYCFIRTKNTPKVRMN